MTDRKPPISAMNRNILIVLTASFYWSLQLMLLDKQRYDIVHGNPLTNWNASEWLIGYQGGFVRRGLFGSPLLWLVQQGLDPYAVITFLPTISYLLLSVIWFSLILRAVIRRGVHWIYFLFALCNPSALYFFVLGGNVYRKDVVFVLLLLIALWTLDSLLNLNKTTINPLFYWATLAVSILAILGLHEGLFIFIALPVLSSFFLSRPLAIDRLRQSFFLRVSIGIFLAVTMVLTASSIIFKGNQYLVTQICSSWSPHFAYQCTAESVHNLGAISPLMWDLKRQLSLSGLRIIFSPLASLTFLMSSIYSSSTAAIFGVLFGSNKLKSYLYLSSIMVFPALMLFLIGCDWGRYLAIVNTLLFMLNASFVRSDQSPPPLFFVSIFKKLNFIMKVFSFGLFSGDSSRAISSIPRRCLPVMLFVFLFMGLNYIGYSSLEQLFSDSVWAHFSERSVWFLQVYLSQSVTGL